MLSYRVLCVTIVFSIYLYKMSQKIVKNKGPNFTQKEVDRLVLLVKQHREGVTCNKTDVKNEIRKEAWAKIANAFNANSTETYRSATALKNKYKNVKSASSRKFSEVKAYVRGTGGGPPPKPVIITTVDETIHEIHGTQLSGLASTFDDDCGRWVLGEDENENLLLDNPIQGDIDVIDGPDLYDEDDVNVLVSTPVESMPLEKTSESSPDNASAHSTTDWSTYNPAKLKQPKSHSLRIDTTTKANSKESEKTRVRPRDMLKTKLGSWAQSKLELGGIQKEAYLAEHAQKVALMKRKHEKEVELLEEESRKRIVLMEEEFKGKRMMLLEEHKMKKEILQLQKDKLSR